MCVTKLTSYDYFIPLHTTMQGSIYMGSLSLDPIHKASCGSNGGRDVSTGYDQRGSLVVYQRKQTTTGTDFQQLTRLYFSPLRITFLVCLVSANK